MAAQPLSEDDLGWNRDKWSPWRLKLQQIQEAMASILEDDWCPRKVIRRTMGTIMPGARPEDLGKNSRGGLYKSYEEYIEDCDNVDYHQDKRMYRTLTEQGRFQIPQLRAPGADRVPLRVFKGNDVLQGAMEAPDGMTIDMALHARGGSVAVPAGQGRRKKTSRRAPDPEPQIQRVQRKRTERTANRQPRREVSPQPQQQYESPPRPERQHSASGIRGASMTARQNSLERDPGPSRAQQMSQSPGRIAVMPPPNGRSAHSRSYSNINPHGRPSRADSREHPRDSGLHSQPPLLNRVSMYSPAGTTAVYPASEGIEVIYACFAGRDVTSFIRQEYRRGERKFNGNPRQFGDPEPRCGVRSLVVVYRDVHGELCNQTCYEPQAVALTNDGNVDTNLVLP